MPEHGAREVPTTRVGVLRSTASLSRVVGLTTQKQVRMYKGMSWDGTYREPLLGLDARCFDVRSPLASSFTGLHIRLHRVLLVLMGPVCFLH